MRRIRRTTKTPSPAVRAPAASSRGGVTLTEVLIAMLAMGIGVVSVATMFPISLLKSIKATQLTNAAILKFNAAERVEFEPGLVHDPDGDFATDPNGFAEHLNLGEWDKNGNGRLDAAEDTVDNNRLDHGRYIVDPIGWAEYSARANGLANSFGHNGGTAANILPRFPGRNPSVMTVAAAEQLAASLDNWEFIGEEVPARMTATSARMPRTFDVSMIPIVGATAQKVASDPPTQVIILDADGRRAARRVLTTLDTSGAQPVLGWDTPIPQEFIDNDGIGDFGMVQLETRKPKYSWLLTVRKDYAGAGNVDVVVFFNRSFNENEERLVEATWSNVAGGVQFTGKVELTFPAGEKPHYKRGSFVLDAVNAEWYRVQDVLSETNTSAELLLDRLVRRTTTAANGGRAILMVGVVDVYPLPIQIYEGQ